jgi:hypothetical protein
MMELGKEFQIFPKLILASGIKHEKARKHDYATRSHKL